MARPGDRPDRGRTARAGSSARAGSTPRPDPTAGSRSAIGSSPAYRRQGVATEVVHALFDWAHRQRRRSLPGVGLAGQRAPRWRSSAGLGFTPGRRPDRRHRRRGARLRARRLAARTPAVELPCSPACPAHDRSSDSTSSAFDTLAVHAGAEPDELTGAVSPPIYQTSTYAQDGVGRPRGGYEYARSQNPTRERLERAVAALEGGAHGIAFASGSAATAAIAELAGPGEEIVVGDDVYGGTYRYLERVHRGKGRRRPLRRPGRRAGRPVGGADRADPARLVRDAVEPAAQGRRHRGDRRRRSRGGRPRAAGGRSWSSTTRSRRRRCQRPLTLGADIVFHSATKYLAGHSDTILGVAATSDDAVAERLRFLQNAMGAVPGPLDCFLVLRGLRTLHLRMERHGANAVAIAAFLADRADVATVHYPGMGGMVSFLPRRRRPARADGRGPGDRDRRGHPPVHPGRVARRRGIADRAAGRDDPHVGGRLAARGRPGARPPVGRHRGRRRPDRGPARALDEA